jgi:Xaa-Pro aminopeptidase
VDEVRRWAFRGIGDRLRAGGRVTDWDIKNFILERFAESGLFTDHGPIVAVNAKTSDPHYEPFPGASEEIHAGDWVLIDLWAKLDQPASVYYDITWTGYIGAHVPSRIANIFDIVCQARDRGIQRVQEAIGRGEDLRGFQVDDAVREFISGRGYGEYFIHRTGPPSAAGARRRSQYRQSRDPR